MAMDQGPHAGSISANLQHVLISAGLGSNTTLQHSLYYRMGQADTKKADISRPAASLTLLKIPYKYVTVFSITLFVMGFALPYLLYYLYGRCTWTHCMVSVLAVL